MICRLCPACKKACVLQLFSDPRRGVKSGARTRLIGFVHLRAGLFVLGIYKGHSPIVPNGKPVVITVFVHTVVHIEAGKTLPEIQHLAAKTVPENRHFIAPVQHAVQFTVGFCLQLGGGKVGSACGDKHTKSAPFRPEQPPVGGDGYGIRCGGGRFLRVFYRNPPKR